MLLPRCEPNIDGTALIGCGATSTRRTSRAPGPNPPRRVVQALAKASPVWVEPYDLTLFFLFVAPMRESLHEIPIARFDHRILVRADNGADFQDFVWEALETGHFDRLAGLRYVRPHFKKGNDGAIDHVVESDIDCVLVESKFFGESRRDRPAAEWRSLATPLRENLGQITKGTPITVPNIYSSWFRKKPRITGYWFCTSGEFHHEGEQSALREEIAKFFLDLAHSYPALDHLAEVNVQVLGWSDFVAVLTAKTPFRFRWFGGVPAGLLPLEFDTAPERFREFLAQKRLPFFSREEFNQGNTRQPNASVAQEGDLLSRLLDASESQLGLVLAGPGGIGKTRLALELGRKARDDLQWQAFRVDQTATAETIEKLGRLHIDKALVLLVMDYAEGIGRLTELVGAMQSVNSSGHRFRFVATCRSGALPSVREALNEVKAEVLEIDDRPAEEYSGWVVRKILAYGAVPNADAVSSICGRMPVLAAFAVYLSKHFRETFDRQFSDIHRGQSFADWVERRLRLALKDRHLDVEDVSRLLASIAIHLPLDDQRYYALRDSSERHARVLDVLERDRWLEPNGGYLSAVHDIFADALVARYVFAGAAKSTTHAGDLLGDRVGSLDRALISLDRLATHPQFGEIDGLKLLRRLHAADADRVIAARATLLRGRLLKDNEKITFLEKFADAATVQDDSECDGPISQLAVGVSKWKVPADRESATNVLRPFLDTAVSRRRSHRMVLGRALRLIPDRYRDQALASIRETPGSSAQPFLLVAWMIAGLPLEEIAHYLEIWLAAGGSATSDASKVIPGWLDRGGAKEFIDTHLRTWFSKYDRSKEANYVYKAWLDADGGTEKIETHVLAWLAEHGTDVSAAFVYPAWLKANGGTSRIEPHVLAWLAVHDTDISAGFVYPAWLDAKGDAAKIESHLLAWLALHGTRSDARFAYSSWLEANGEPEKIEDHVLAWFAVNGTDPNAGFVYRAWLEARKEPEKIEIHALAWLDAHGTEVSAGYLYPAWLEAKGDATKIEKRLFAWLDAQGTGISARFVYTAWLKANGDPERIETHLLAWLGKFGADVSAGFIYPAWLEAKGGVAKIETHLLAWLAAHGTDLNARFVYTGWLKATGDTDRIEVPLLAWLAEHGRDPSARYVYRAWLHANGSTSKIEAFLLPWLEEDISEESASIVRLWLKANGEPEKIAAYVRSWLGRHGTELDAEFLYNAWLRGGGDLATVESFLTDWISRHELTYAAGYVYRRWLNAGGSLPAIEANVRNWLVLHHEQEHAGVVYWSWLEAGGSVVEIEPFLSVWRRRHRLFQEAGEVYRALLNAKVPHAALAEDAIAWLTQHQLRSEAGPLYQAWLNANGPVAAIETFLLGWLARHRGTDLGRSLAATYEALVSKEAK